MTGRNDPARTHDQESSRDDRALGDTNVSQPFVLEVLSPSTTDKNQGEKLGMYELLPSLQAYLIVDPIRPIIEGHFRTKLGGSWKREQFGPTAHITLPCPEGLVLAVDDFYS